MDRTTVQDALNPDCPIRNVLARIGDKWSLLVIVTLSGARTMRFGALQRAIPDISQKMLSVTLRTLEEDGYLTRQVYPEVPPRVEYSLTSRAQSLLACIDPLVAWADANMADILNDRKTARRGAVTRRRDPFRCGTGDRRTTTPRPAAISCSRAGRRVPGCAVLEMPSAVTAAGTRR